MVPSAVQTAVVQTVQAINDAGEQLAAAAAVLPVAQHVDRSREAQPDRPNRHFRRAYASIARRARKRRR